MRRARSSEYVTIPLQDIEIDGSSLQPAEGLVHHKHAEQVEGSLAFEDEVSGLEAATLTFAEAEISYSLDRIAKDLTQGLVLLVDYGDQAIPIIRACAKAGLSAAVTCTDDLMGQPYLGAASSYTSLGPVFSEAIFKNSYAILKAAEACGAEAILIIDPELVEDEFFLARCKASSLFVFKAPMPTNPYLGWALVRAKPHWKARQQLGGSVLIVIFYLIEKAFSSTTASALPARGIYGCLQRSESKTSWIRTAL